MLLSLYSSHPVEIEPRGGEVRHPAQTDNYPKPIIKEIKDLFGDESPEYGMALCGAPHLIEHLKYYHESFSADDILATRESGEDSEALVKNAEFVIKVADLRLRAQKGMKYQQGPPWFKVEQT